MNARRLLLVGVAVAAIAGLATVLAGAAGWLPSPPPPHVQRNPPPAVGGWPEEPGDGPRVLYVGNSLTHSNNLPALVRALAVAAGEKPTAYRSVVMPGYSLADHWDHSNVRREIDNGPWNVVVLQQGPSALPESRVELRASARRFADAARQGGARPGLFMVWPSRERSRDFDRVCESYRLAAEDVDGLLFPAGEAWRAAWRRDPNLELYSDGLHPTHAGSYLAALVIFARLYEKPPTGLPAQLPGGPNGRPLLDLPAEQAALLQAAAVEALAQSEKGRQ